MVMVRHALSMPLFPSIIVFLLCVVAIEIDRRANVVYIMAYSV
jgi:hypothetical protein